MILSGEIIPFASDGFLRIKDQYHNRN